MAVRQVNAAVELLDGGATVPFIARYRKEATGALDDAQLRTLEERLRYLRELDERRDAILKEIAAQGKLTDELEAQIRAADSKARLEDLYLPYKPKRRTKAQIAREAGLEPLADLLLHDPSNDPQRAAADFVDPDRGVPDAGRRPGRRPRHPGRAVRRGRGPARRAARVDGRPRLADLQGPRGPGGRRARSSPTTSSSASRSRGCPRTACWPCSAARRRRSSTSPWSPGPRTRSSSSASPGGSASATNDARPTRGCRPRCTGPGAPAS